MKELFEFAVKIRTNLDDQTAAKRIDSVIDRLALNKCADQLVGGWLRRGISGGERKRTSIGYELITDP